MRCLEDAGYRVTAMETADGAADLVEREMVDLAVVDLNLPGAIDGLSLTRTLKATSDIGLIILSGRSEATERIVGLEIGADDYVTKPFEPRELLARVRSVLRRVNRKPAVPVSPCEPLAVSDASVLEFASWRLDVTTRTLTDDADNLISLTAGEFDLLRVLAEHPNRVLSRDQLMDYLHGDRTPAFDRSIDVRVRRVRQKIENDPQDPKLIRTIRNGGYMLAAKVNRR